MKQIPEDIINKLKAVIRRIEVAAAFDGIGTEDFNIATSVVRLAEIAGMSERSLRDYFKTYTGKSIVRYVSARRAEYAARIFRLFPKISKSEAARIIGFNCPNGIYGLMRKNGIDNIDALHKNILVKSERLPFRLERLEDCKMFYRQENAVYKICSEIKFEEDNWNKIERFVATKFPKAQIIGYVGFAIDRYIADDSESGIFISGILYRGISTQNLQQDMIGEIGWQSIHSGKYAVFIHRGSYDNLDAFYSQVISNIHQLKNLKIDISIPIMEKYLNSPSDTPEEELITELWIPLLN